MSATQNLPIVGVSSCLLGERVRYDGREKRAPWVAEHLAEIVELVSLCPEVGAGMSIPRPPIQVVKPPGAALRVLRVHDGHDVTDELQAFATRSLDQLDARGIDGYVFKARSPSCGLRDTPHFASDGSDAAVFSMGMGLWARAVTERWPALPVIDEAGLSEPAARRRFLDAVMAHFEARQGANA